MMTAKYADSVAPAMGVPAMVPPASYAQPTIVTVNPEAGSPAVLGRTPDGRTVVSLPLRLFQQGGDARFPDNYTQMLQGRLPYNVYRDILDTLNTVAAEFVHPNGSIIMPVSFFTMGLGLLPLMQFYSHQQMKMFRALDDAIDKINRQYSGMGVSLRRNVAAAELQAAGSSGRRSRRHLPAWQADLEVMCAA